MIFILSIYSVHVKVKWWIILDCSLIEVLLDYFTPILDGIITAVYHRIVTWSKSVYENSRWENLDRKVIRDSNMLSIMFQ